MVDRVDHQIGCSDRLCDQGVGFDGDRLVPGEDDVALHHVAGRSQHRGNVLVERPSECHVEDLDTPANGKGGHAPNAGLPGEREFEFVPARIGLADRCVSLFAVAPRFDVAPAGEDEAVEMIHECGDVRLGKWREDDREAAGAQHGVGVGVSDDLRLEFTVGTDGHLLLGGNADDRVHPGDSRNGSGPRIRFGVTSVCRLAYPPEAFWNPTRSCRSRNRSPISLR